MKSSTEITSKQIGHSPMLKTILFICVLSLFGTMAACNLGGTGTAKYGILKSDPNVQSSGFGFVNAVKKLNGEVSVDALAVESVLKMVDRGNDNLYVITQNKGIFVTKDGGKNWQRLYVYPVDGKGSKEQNEQIVANDLLKINDFTFAKESKDRKSVV